MCNMTSYHDSKVHSYDIAEHLSNHCISLFCHVNSCTFDYSCYSLNWYCIKATSVDLVYGVDNVRTTLYYVDSDAILPKGFMVYMGIAQGDIMI